MRIHKNKIDRTEATIKSKIVTNLVVGKVKRTITAYYISRELPLSFESIEHIIITEGDEMDALIDTYVNDVDLRSLYYHFEEDTLNTKSSHFKSSTDFIYSIDQHYK